MTIVIKYPPDYDGELHITVEPRPGAFNYSFTHADKGTEWETLVCAAEAILAQNKRRKEKQ